jgi:hypothetical protein
MVLLKPSMETTTSNSATTASFHILSNSVFTNHAQVHPRYEPHNVIPCVGNFTEGKSRVMLEFPTGL